MVSYRLSARDLEYLVSELASTHEVLAPVQKGGSCVYAKIESLSETNIRCVNTAYPPKKYFIPEGGGLFSYRDADIAKARGTGKRVLFGVRPCDVNALNRLDLIFLTEPKDGLYQRAKENTLVLALACQTAGPNCFCESLGTDKVEEGFDLLFTPKGRGYTVKVGSERGELLLGGRHPKTADEPQAGVRCEKKIDLEGIRKLESSFNDKVFTEDAQRCLSCGSCTISCPTCTCFTVLDEPELDLSAGARRRYHASCQLVEFTKVAGGFVFREDRFKRRRQFVYHKLSYFEKQHGKHLCVGCGRCITNCPTAIDITETVGAL